MNKKILISVLALFTFSMLLVSLASAIDADITTPGPLTNLDKTTSFALTNNEAFALDVTGWDSSITISDGNGHNTILSLVANTSNPLTSIAIGETVNVAVNVTSVDSDFSLGTYSEDLEITLLEDTNSSNNEIRTISFSFENTFCEYENNGNLDIRIKDITNNGISGHSVGEDDMWYPLSEIEIEIKVENNGNDDIDNIEVEWGLYDSSNGEWLIRDDEKDFDLRDGKEEIITVTFRLDNSDLDLDVDELNDGTYTFYAKATGEDQDTDETICDSDSEDIDIVIDNDFVVLDDITIQETVECGEELEITADVWNIGDDDQDDVSVLVEIKELNIKEEVDIGDIDSLTDEKFSFSFEIPGDAKEKTYAVTLTVQDEDGDVFENDNDDTAEFTATFDLAGSCEAESDVAISASLESEAIAGEIMTIKVVLTNTGSADSTYTIAVKNIEDWASLDKIEPSVLTISEGETGEALIYLDINNDAEGEKIFSIEVSSGDMTKSKNVAVFLEKGGAGITGGVIGAALGGNAVIWAIAALNIVLVIVIIIIAVRVAKQ